MAETIQHGWRCFTGMQPDYAPSVAAYLIPQQSLCQADRL